MFPTKTRQSLIQNSPLKVIRLTKSPPWKSKIATLWCDENCQNNIDQHVNILTGKYFNFNFKYMGKTFNKPNKLISAQFNTI